MFNSPPYLKAVFNPTGEQLSAIKHWLLEEEQATGDGFYCNWNVIEDNFQRGRMAVMLIEELPIGFIIWYQSDLVAEISIAEVHPKYRRKGYGALMIEQFEKFMASDGIVALGLLCQPAESEKAWKKLGYKRRPDFTDQGQGAEMYKIIASCQPLLPPRKKKARHLIEVWDMEPYMIRDEKPLYRWEARLVEDTEELVRPIIFPCKPDWQIAWSIDGTLHKKTKIKYFDRENDIAYAGFGVILVLSN